MSPPDAHSGARRQELLYDPTTPTPTHAERAMTMASGIRDAALSTMSVAHPGTPYGSLVLFALHQGTPAFLLSGLAEHTRNLKADPRCSVMVKEAGSANPLALGRITLVGTCAVTEDKAVRETFLARHPDAAFYADFKDFAFWRLQVTGVRYIGGFGRMSWVDVPAWNAAEPDPIAGAADGILQHMNADHGEALRLYCEAFSKSGPVPNATMTGVDRYGFEMSAQTPDGPRPIRVAFDEPVGDAKAVRIAMVALVARAREQLGIG